MTLRYTFNHSEEVAAFVAGMIPHIRRGFGPCVAMGIVREDNELIGGMVYHHHCPEAEWMEISGAALPGHQWLSRETLRQMHEYPFAHCRCQMVIMRIKDDNTRLKRQLEALGYECILLPRIYGRGEDGYYCYLTEEAWLANKIFRRLYRNSAEPIDKAA